MSARTIRPPGPLPWMLDRSMFCACARRRASGEALTRSPSARGGLPGGLRRRGRGFDRRCGGRRASELHRPWARRGAFGGAGAAVSGLGRCAASRLFAFVGHDRDRRADLHAVGALGHQDLGDLAFVDRFELHRRLVGLDLGEDVARLYLIAFLDQPFGERAFLHRRGKRGHLEFDGHEGSS